MYPTLQNNLAKRKQVFTSALVHHLLTQGWQGIIGDVSGMYHVPWGIEHSMNNKLVYRTKTLRDYSTNAIESTVQFGLEQTG